MYSVSEPSIAGQKPKRGTPTMGGLLFCVASVIVTGIATAQLDSVPMVAITGNVPGALIGKDAFQEIDITGITLPMTKHNYLVRKADDIPRVIAEAFYIARTGRPGPVHVDITKDALQGETKAPHPTLEQIEAGLPGFKPNLDGHPRQLKVAAAEIGVPHAFSLDQNWPNPFNPSTTIRYTIPEKAKVTLKVFNILGQEVARPVDHSDMEEGLQVVDFDASAFASGVYFYQVITNQMGRFVKKRLKITRRGNHNASHSQEMDHI